MDSPPRMVDEIAVWVGILGDSMTFLLGAATIYAFFAYGRRILSAVRVMAIYYEGEKIAEIRGTIKVIREIALEKGPNRPVREQFAKLSGQLSVLKFASAEMMKIHAEVDEIGLRRGALNEAIRAKLTHQLESEIEASRIKSLVEIGGGHEE